jgi:hypothetical protein
VYILGQTDLPSRMAPTSSNLYSSNVCHLLDDMGKAEKFHVNEEDEVVRAMLIVNKGEMKWPPPRKASPAGDLLRRALLLPAVACVARRCLSTAEMQALDPSSR